MNQQPDKLFRDKLENYQRAVPTSAWERIAAKQDKKKPYSGWLKFAASLLLVAGATAVWLSIQPGTPAESTLAENQVSAPGGSPSSPQASTGKTDSTVAPSSSPATGTSSPETATPAINPTPSASRPIRQKVDGRKAVSADPSADVDDNNDIAMRNSANSQPPREQQSEVASTERLAATADTHAAKGVNPVVIAAQGVTLTYTTDDVSSYLDKNIDDEATDDDKKQSTLKKLLQKANDLKTNQDPFGELRQRKNEILALNFKNDKRGQKTRN